MSDPEYPFVVKTYTLDDGRRIHVVRDDTVLGGTKQRVLEKILTPGIEYVYGGPRFGFAQVALAVAAEKVGAKATLFVAKANELHPRTVLAQSHGAKITQVENGMLTVVLARAREYTRRHVGCSMLSEGFDYHAFHRTLVSIVKQVPLRPKQVWCVISTGTLYRGLRAAWPKAEIHGVQVGMIPRLREPDPLLTLHIAPEKYQQDAKIPAPYPSCSNSDRKVWQFVLKHAVDDATVWNVAAG